MCSMCLLARQKFPFQCGTGGQAQADAGTSCKLMYVRMRTWCRLCVIDGMPQARHWVHLCSGMLQPGRYMPRTSVCIPILHGCCCPEANVAGTHATAVAVACQAHGNWGERVQERTSACAVCGVGGVHACSRCFVAHLLTHHEVSPWVLTQSWCIYVCWRVHGMRTLGSTKHGTGETTTRSCSPRHFHPTSNQHPWRSVSW